MLCTKSITPKTDSAACLALPTISKSDPPVTMTLIAKNEDIPAYVWY